MGSMRRVDVLHMALSDTATINCSGVMSGLRRCLTRRHRCSRASIPSPTRWAKQPIISFWKSMVKFVNQHKKRCLAARTVNPGTGEWVVPEDEHFVACESIDLDICGLQGRVCGVLQTYWQSAVAICISMRTSRNQKALSKPPTMQRQKRCPRSSRLWTARSGLADWICKISKMKRPKWKYAEIFVGTTSSNLARPKQRLLSWLAVVCLA